uniref:LITAF domain-containing protein n=1 Tax=Leptobrachium leishanense TaxID=445787 RepID=A0A8C5QY81_9ANUR
MAPLLDSGKLQVLHEIRDQDRHSYVLPQIPIFLDGTDKGENLKFITPQFIQKMNPAYQQAGNPPYSQAGNPPYSQAGNPPYPQAGVNNPLPTYTPDSQPPYKVYVTPVMNTSVIYSFQDTPAAATCPACNQAIITRIVYNTGLLTWLIFGLLLLFCCWLGCCLIPFCCNSCKDVDHFCPKCNHHLYKYKRL